MILPKHNEMGFTGLEAAIVLIAFVVVAAVFSYVILGAGFYTTQKAQQTVHTSVEQSSSTLEIVGNVYGSGTGDGSSSSTIKFVNFSVELAPGGTAIDFGNMVVVYSNASTLQTLSGDSNASTVISQPVPGGWAITGVQNPPGGDITNVSILLQPNEQFQLSVEPTNPVMIDDTFTIEIRPAIGAAFSITRTAPAAIYTINSLY